jgi:hypothetical protein
MPLDLHQKLEAERRSEGLTLHEDIERIRDKAFRIWESQRLAFFTDHRAQTHSTAIIRILGELLEPLFGTDKSLNAPELFILLAASYLHDIGMQDLRIDGRGIEEFTSEDYDLIRRRHPERGAELIRKKKISLQGAPDPYTFEMPNASYIELVAMVSKAHGSDYFDECVSELRNNTTKLNGKDIRPALLAALLMIADELHIGEGRAPSREGIPISPTSKLHFIANHYVTAVDINFGGGRANIVLHLTLPDTADSYETNLKHWIGRKLIRQIRRANAVFRETCDGVLMIEERIEFPEPDRSELRWELPDCAKDVLESEVKESTLVDREELLETLRREWLNKPSSFKCIGIHDRPNSDWAQISSALKSNADVKGALIISLSFDLSVAHSPLDLLRRLQGQLAESKASDSSKTIPQGKTGLRAENHLQETIDILESASCGTETMMILENPNFADDVTKEWLANTLLPSLNKRNVPLCTVIVAKRDGKHNKNVNNILSYASEEFTLSNFSVGDIADYLSSVRGFSDSEAHDKADYVHTLSDSGIPDRVILGQRNRLHKSEVISR